MLLTRWKLMAGVLGVSIGGLAAAASQCPKLDTSKGRQPDAPVTAEAPKLPPAGAPSAPAPQLPDLPAPPATAPSAPQLTPAGATSAAPPVVFPDTKPTVPPAPPAPVADLPKVPTAPVASPPALPDFPAPAQEPKPAKFPEPVKGGAAPALPILPDVPPATKPTAPMTAPMTTPKPVTEPTKAAPLPFADLVPAPTKPPAAVTELMPVTNATPPAKATAPVLPVSGTQPPASVPPIGAEPVKNPPALGVPSDPPAVIDVPPSKPTVAPADAAVKAGAPKYRILLRVGEGEPTFEVKAGDDLVLKVACEKVDIKSPEKGAGLSAVTARGKVRFAGFGVEGTCEELSFMAGTGEVSMSGEVKVQMKDKLGRVESELSTSILKYKIDTSAVGAAIKP